MTAMRIGIAIDTVLLTAFLYFYGGYQNPFSMFYLVLIVEAAFFLTPKDTWLVFSATVVSLIVLFNFYISIPLLEMSGHHQHHSHDPLGFSVHLHGMFISFLIIGFFISFFLVGFQQRLEKERKNFSVIKDLANKHYQRAAVHSIAAQLAHQLATPLTTATMIADDLSENVLSTDTDIQTSEHVQQISLLQKSLAKASDAIQKMRESYSSLEAEVTNQSDVMTLKDIIDRSFTRFADDASIEVEFSPDLQNITSRLPSEGLILALSTVIDNAVRYGTKQKVIHVRGVSEIQNSLVKISIFNFGPGFRDEILNHFGQPLFSLQKNQGLGLGLFLVKDFLEQGGGGLVIENQFSKDGDMIIGALVTLDIPLELNNERS